MFYPLVHCSYKVELQTSDLLGAGTSANGVISLLGKLAEAGPIQLVNNGGNFQRGSLDVMTLDDLPDIGAIQQVLGSILTEPAFTARWKETPMQEVCCCCCSAEDASRCACTGMA